MASLACRHTDSHGQHRNRIDQLGERFRSALGQTTVQIRDDRLPECVEGSADLIAPQEFVSIRGEVRSANERTGGAQLRSASHFAAFIFFTLEGVSEAEIGLDKVVVSQIWEVITNFAENPNMGSKAIFESDAGMPEHAVPPGNRRKLVRARPVRVTARPEHLVVVLTKTFY